MTSLHHHIPPPLRILSPNVLHPIIVVIAIIAVTVVIVIAVKVITVIVIKVETVIAVIIIMVIKQTASAVK